MRGIKNRHLIIYALLAATLIGLYVLIYPRSFKADEFVPNQDHPDIIWTGNGTDETCSNALSPILDSGKWFSCASNWNTNTVPGESNDIIFTQSSDEYPNSTKNAIIDTAFGNTIHDLIIEYGYIGTITQSKDLTITGNFEQNGGKFDSNPIYAFNVLNSFFVANNQISNGSVYAIKKDSLGNIYVGGSFTSVNGLPIKYFAKFNGKRWSQVGTDSLDGPVRSIAVDSMNNVYAGGEFISAGGLSLNGILKWDGSSMISLGGGVLDGYSNRVPGEINSLVIDNQDRVYAGGTFLHAGSTEYANHLARWNGTVWEKFGFGLGNFKYDYKGEYNSTTSYERAMVVSFNGTYYYNINSSDYSDKSGRQPDIYPDIWTPLDRLVGDVSVLKYRDNALYVGGEFANICQNELCMDYLGSAYGLAKIDLSSDSFVADFGRGSNGIDGPISKGTVKGIDFDDSGNLVIIGSSIIKIGSSTYSIAKWNNIDWTGYSATNQTRNAVSAINNELFIGQNRTARSQYLFAQWKDSYWFYPSGEAGTFEATTGKGFYGSEIRTLEEIDGRIYIGGDFSDIYHNSGNDYQNIMERSGGIAIYDPVSNSTKPLLNMAEFNRFSGGDGFGISTPYLISDIYALQSIIVKQSYKSYSYPTLALPMYYKVSGNIDATGTAKWNNNFGFLSLSNKLSTFFGNFDGGDFSITRLKLSGGESYLGLFGQTDIGSSIQNIVLADSSLSSTKFENYAGLVVGRNNGGSIIDVTVSGSINLNGRVNMPGRNVGGIIGLNTTNQYSNTNVAYTPLQDLNSNVAISGSYLFNVGGILGSQVRIPTKMKSVACGFNPSLLSCSSAESQISLSYNNFNSSGSININNTTGNIGGSIGSIEHEYTTVNGASSGVDIIIAADDQNMPLPSIENIGGLIGYSYAKITNASSTGDLSINITPSDFDLYNIGGLAGKIAYPNSIDTVLLLASSSGTINISQNNGFISAVGGMAGSSISAAFSNTNSLSSLSISSRGEVKHIGGLTGISDSGDIANSYSEGSLSIDNSTSSNSFATGNFGGLVGFSNFQNINNSYSTSNLTINADNSCSNDGGGVGGLIGNRSTSVDHILNQSYSKGTITTNCQKVGGFVGINNGKIKESFSQSLVSGHKFVGGFVGYSIGWDSSIRDSFSLGNVTADEYGGSFIGYAEDNIISNSYALGSVSSAALGGGFIGAYDYRDTGFSFDHWLKVDGALNSNLSDASQERVDGFLGTNIINNKDNTNINFGSKNTLKSAATFATFDFSNVWSIDNEKTYPYLKVFSSYSPEVASLSVSNINETSASLVANVININGFNSHTIGFEYGLNQDSVSSTYDEGTNSSFGGNYNTGQYSKGISNLLPGTMYYYRAFAANPCGISYGDWKTFTTQGSTINNPFDDPNVLALTKSKVYGYPTFNYLLEAKTTTSLSSIQWSKVSGPGTITISNSNDLASQVRASSPGSYVIKLSVANNQNQLAERITEFIVHRPGDINNDNIIGESDFTILLFAWNDKTKSVMSDLNNDNNVDDNDFTLLSYWWGR